VIVEIYASDDGAENWQEDLLGSAVLLPGRAVFVDIDVLSRRTNSARIWRMPN
jgi:hypothetical protein